MSGINSDHVSNVRQCATDIFSAIQRLHALNAQSGYLGLNVNKISAEDIRDSDVTAEDILAVTGDTLDALDALLKEGYGAKLAKVAYGIGKHQ